MLTHIRTAVFFVGLLVIMLSIPVMVVGGVTEWLSTDVIASILMVDFLVGMLVVALGGEF